VREVFGFELSMFESVIVPIKIFQFQDMLNENRFLRTFRGHSKRSITFNVIIFPQAPNIAQ
jgi:hypothetical protein